MSKNLLARLTDAIHHRRGCHRISDSCAIAIAARPVPVTKLFRNKHISPAAALGPLIISVLLPVITACSSETSKEPPPAATVVARSQPLSLPSPPHTQPIQARPPVLLELAVRFTGSVIRADGTHSRALLSVAGAPSREMAVGEQIAEGITLSEIREDEITLQAGALTRRILMERALATMSLGSVPAMPPPAPFTLDEPFRQALKEQNAGQK